MTPETFADVLRTKWKGDANSFARLMHLPASNTDVAPVVRRHYLIAKGLDLPTHHVPLTVSMLQSSIEALGLTRSQRVCELPAWAP